MCGKGMEAVALRGIRACFVQLHPRLRSLDGQQHEVCLVSSRFKSMTFINDPRSIKSKVSEAVSAAGENGLPSDICGKIVNEGFD